MIGDEEVGDALVSGLDHGRRVFLGALAGAVEIGGDLGVAIDDEARGRAGDVDGSWLGRLVASNVVACRYPGSVDPVGAVGTSGATIIVSNGITSVAIKRAQAYPLRGLPKCAFRTRTCIVVSAPLIETFDCLPSHSAAQVVSEVTNLSSELQYLV